MPFTNQLLIDFFKQRMVELYDRNTLDTYAVRTCNTMSILCELKEMLNGWIVGNVKRGETVGLCVDECVMMIDKDEWMNFSFYDKGKLKSDLETYSKSVKQVKDCKDKKDKDYIEVQNIFRLVNTCIGQNEKGYLKSLVDAVRDDLLTVKTYQDEEYKKKLDGLDLKLSLMATELLRRGYSKIYLYQYFMRMKRNAATPFATLYSQFSSKIGTVRDYTDFVIVRIHFRSTNIPVVPDMLEGVPLEYQHAMTEAMKGFAKKQDGRRFYIVKVTAPDTNAALQKARLQLSQTLDRNGIGQIETAKQGIVAYKENGSWTLRWEHYYDLDKRSPRGGNAAGMLATVMQRIDVSSCISQEIKERLNTALRHLRVGDDQEEIEQRFLNYWIGLEFLFATPRSGDSTFTRVKERFPQMKSLYYLKRNVLALDKWLKEKHLMAADDSMGSATEPQMDTMFTAATEALLKYRIKKMKGHLHDHEKVKNYLKSHIRNLEWHLSRIYHMRNELVHEAAIKQSVTGVAGNLRDYLVFMLNILLDYCERQMANHQEQMLSMDDFFWYHDLLWKKLTPEYDKAQLMALQMPVEYVR